MSGDPSRSPDDADLTERLRAAAELVGVLARDHVIVAAGGYYSFVEAGRTVSAAQRITELRPLALRGRAPLPDGRR